ncbi:MAG: hypothetical protein ACR2OO_15270 [Thermomicrobiales bacterium]
MDEERFDRLARLLGTGSSRRGILKGVLGSLVGLSAAGLAAGSASAAGGFGDACTADGQCDSSAMSTCDDDRSTCRGAVGYACFDTGDCSTADALLCLDANGTECTGEVAECGTCGSPAAACFGQGHACDDATNCCEGLTCSSVGASGGAICHAPVVSGSATITIHKATCPHGVGASIFTDCHDNVLGGVSFAVDGFEIGSGVITTDSGGAASKTILEAAASGDVTLTEDSATLAGYLGAYVYCSEQGSGTVLFDSDAPGGTVTFSAKQGDAIICRLVQHHCGRDQRAGRAAGDQRAGRAAGDQRQRNDHLAEHGRGKRPRWPKHELARSGGAGRSRGAVRGQEGPRWREFPGLSANPRSPGATGRAVRGTVLFEGPPVVPGSTTGGRPAPFGRALGQAGGLRPRQDRRRARGDGTRRARWRDACLRGPGSPLVPRQKRRGTRRGT